MSAESNVLPKEDFDTLRIEISRLFSGSEFVLEEREQLLNVDDSIEEKLKNYFSLIEQKLTLLNTALSQLKNNINNGSDLVRKEELKTVMEERFTMLKAKKEGGYVNEKKYTDNREKLEKLEESFGGEVIGSPEESVEAQSKKEDNATAATKKKEIDKDKEKVEKKASESALLRFMVLLFLFVIALSVIYYSKKNKWIFDMDENETENEEL